MAIGVLHTVVGVLLFFAIAKFSDSHVDNRWHSRLSLHTGYCGGDFGKRDVYAARVFYIGTELFHD